MKNPLFNHDRFNTRKKCKKMYYFKYIKELKLPEFHNDYNLGNEVHALIDYRLRGLNIDPLLKDADKEVVELWDSIKNRSIMNKKVIKTERSFNVPVPRTSCRLIGRIDAIFFDEEKNKYIITDWKTGKFVPQKMHSDFQHKVYLYAFYQSRKDSGLDFEPEDLCFRYYKITPDDIEITQTDFSKEKLIEYEETFRNIIIETETAEEFPKPDNCPFKNCMYKTFC